MLLDRNVLTFIGKAWKVGQDAPPDFPADRRSWSFGQLLGWHLDRGTRPGESPEAPAGKRQWTDDEFSTRFGCAEKTVKNWRRKQKATVPSDRDYQTIEALLFGDDNAFHEWRAELRSAHRRARAGNVNKLQPTGSPAASTDSGNSSEKRGGSAEVEQGEPVATIRKRHDAHGRVIEEAYFGVGGQPVHGKDGAPLVRWEYDDQNRVNAVAHFESDGRPTLNPGGAARITWKRDDQGRVIEHAFFDVDGKPTLGVNEGVARTTWKFGEQGRWTEEAYFGIDGKPKAGKQEGVPRARWDYDAQRRVIAVSYFDGDGRPMLNPDGVARRTWTYDDQGGSEEKRFGVDWNAVSGNGSTA